MTAKHRILALIVSVFIVAAGWGCSSSRDLAPGEEVIFEETTFSFDQDTYPTELNLFADYHMTPGDVLDVLFQIRTWEEKDTFNLAVDHTVSVKFVHVPSLSEMQKVRPDGKITLPYVGEVYVVGKTVNGLTSELRGMYKEILRDPEVYVTVPEFDARIKELKKDLHTAPRGLSRLVTIRPDGYVTFPMVGDMFVAGKTIPQAQKELQTKYTEFIPELHVDLFLQEHAGSVVYVLGEVKNANTFKIVKPITAVQAITLAGGQLPSANLDNVVVFRRHGQKIYATQVDVGGNLSLTKSGQMFFLQPDDILFVPKSGLYRTAEIMTKVQEILLFRGWNIGLNGPLFEEPIIGPDDDDDNNN